MSVCTAEMTGPSDIPCPQQTNQLLQKVDNMTNKLGTSSLTPRVEHSGDVGRPLAAGQHTRQALGGSFVETALAGGPFPWTDDMIARVAPTAGGHPAPTAAGLEVLADRAWEDLAVARAEHPNAVPVECAPVLLFGDVEAYSSSSLRVVTVGLNPSGREFPLPDPWMRFPGVQRRETYLDALCRYFDVASLDWFSCFREVLGGLDASFFDGASNRAVHTDICSVVPTAPTWSGLSRTVQRDLEIRGVETWHRLITELRPDIIVSSVRYALLDLITFEALTPWEPVHIVERTNPYVVEGRWLRQPGGSTTLLVRGRAANTPFGTISNPDRYVVGQSIGRYL